MDIAQRLKDARIKNNLTQEQVAEKILVSRVTLSHWENGKSLPDIVSLIALSDLFNLSLDELIKGDMKMTEKVKADAKKAKSNNRLIGITAIFVTTVLIIYGISIPIGGGFHDFCDSAVIWVLVGIGIAAYMAYCSQNEK